MILGYKKLKDCEPGQLVRLEGGSYLLLSEYRTGNDKVFDAYISGSGENFAAGERFADTWVAIIDLGWIELNIEDELEYPVQPTVQQQAQPND